MITNIDNKTLLQVAILGLIEQENMHPRDVMALVKKETEKIWIGLQLEKQDSN
jgi:hypothetical protein